MNARELIEQSRSRIGNARLTATVKRLADALTKAGLSYAMVGGYAVQHYGYPRFTEDADVIVRNVEAARNALLRSDNFRPVQGSTTMLVDRVHGTPIDLLLAGACDSSAALPYPQPVSGELGRITFVTLPQLLAMKLSAGRMKDQADVVELIKANNLKPDFANDLPEELRGKFGEMLATSAREIIESERWLKTQNAR